jgi:hypothetical protein
MTKCIRMVLVTLALLAVATMLLGGSASAVLLRDAKYISDNMPGKTPVGQPVTVTITMKNTGMDAWFPGEGYRLYVGGWDGVPVSKVTRLSQTCTFKCTIPCGILGANSLLVMMAYNDGVHSSVYFGERHEIKFFVTGDSSSFISDTIPTQIQHDHNVAVTVKFKNTGTMTWTSASGYGLLYRGSRVAQVSGRVAPGGTATFTFNINVHTPGDYAISLQMSKNNVPFGTVRSKGLKVI